MAIDPSSSGAPESGSPEEPIRHISDTARWVAVYRAMETGRSDAIFHDPFARRLAGERGEAIVTAMKRGRAMAWPMIVRTAVFDKVIMETVRGRQADTVINLAAGLDARPWRLDLPKSLKWVDVDLPAILEYKTNILRDTPANCQYDAIATDLTDARRREALFSQLGRLGSRALVVTEGLLVYLADDDVKALARALQSIPTFRWWLFDLGSPRLLKLMKRMWSKGVASGDIIFRFAPAEGVEFFRPLGWREVEYHSMLEEAHRLHREMRGMWLWRLLGRLGSKKRREELRRMSGMVLLERD